MHSTTLQTIVSHVARYTSDTRKACVLDRLVKLQLCGIILQNHFINGGSLKMKPKSSLMCSKKE